jgi:hypothetical protein
MKHPKLRSISISALMAFGSVTVSAQTRPIAANEASEKVSLEPGASMIGKQ